jgi:AraC family L-rhamnose operon regulatory protein RhaS
MKVTAYTPIEEWGWTLLVSVHRTSGLGSVPLEAGAFRFHWVVEGSVTAAFGGETVRIQGPSLLCLGSRDAVTLIDEDAEVRTVVFHPGALNDAFLQQDVYDLEAFGGTTRSDQYYLHPFIERHGPPTSIPLPLPAVDRLQFLFDRMEEEIRTRGDGFWPCRTRSLLLEALILTRQGLAPVPEPEFVDRLLVHLHTHYAEPFTLPGLAARFATNRTTLAAKFREKTGTSVGEYLRHLRVGVAEVLLRDTGVPVTEVMERVGFADPSQFGRLFRRATGLSPSEYRQRHSWMLRAS